MKFSELEKLMFDRGITSLADIARTLNTTPQAVSNWKARDQVPYHIVNKVNKKPEIHPTMMNQSIDFTQDSISLSGMVLIIAEQLKVILLTIFISIFATITYTQFLKTPLYISSATILLPEMTNNSAGGLAGLASQFGVDVPSGAQADLSSPKLFPELLRSRRFAETILYKKFYSKQFDKKITLMEILIGKELNEVNEYNIQNSVYELGRKIYFKSDLESSISSIRVSVHEPIFAKELASAVIEELESLNRYFKRENVSEKIIFIQDRILAVENDLKKSEYQLKLFNEQNQQISTPSLQLEQDRLMRNVEVQRGIYLTLKQQLELAKIEEVQQTSIVQILDKPQLPLMPSNKNLKISILFGTLLGLTFGLVFGFVRNYFNSPDMNQRKKIRRIKNFLKKKSKDLFMDTRVTGIISVTLLLGLPYYISYKSYKPIFFGMYSSNYFLLILLYVSLLLFFSSSYLLIKLRKKKSWQ